jgi:hypothetical protein
MPSYVGERCALPPCRAAATRKAKPQCNDGRAIAKPWAGQRIATATAQVLLGDLARGMETHYHRDEQATK